MLEALLLVLSLGIQSLNDLLSLSFHVESLQLGERPGHVLHGHGKHSGGNMKASQDVH